MLVHEMNGRKLNLMFRVAQTYSEEATCPRANGGAVIFTDDFHVVTSGYNGAPRGLPQCKDVGCKIIDKHCARACHAETNTIVQAARTGVSIEGLHLATLLYPCPWCIRLILQAGIKNIYYKDLVKSYNVEHEAFVSMLCKLSGVGLYQWRLDEGS